MPSMGEKSLTLACLKSSTLAACHLAQASLISEIRSTSAWQTPDNGLMPVCVTSERIPPTNGPSLKSLESGVRHQVAPGSTVRGSLRTMRKRWSTSSSIREISLPTWHSKLSRETRYLPWGRSGARWGAATSRAGLLKGRM